ncbi:hypothetical protein, partial [Microbispora hainanensis]|uniref:hypothetical protein n=1 Tax=Microbispora hainanensis TaxID=568844 RepID=UPI001ABFE26E
MPRVDRELGRRHVRGGTPRHLAGGAGYFDQARSGHESGPFAGLTPTRYVEVRRRFLHGHPGHVLDGRPID